ncbi:unnamed protein product [Pleuronectes platessa]|uniref:Uncharacterized protein n=1 Tax=Pleuronectes platessa TaxID=8262 RepID=A0A9N7VR51_PLEPL|nr:unnamed protein product [Pleuronectes platessa]
MTVSEKREHIFSLELHPSLPIRSHCLSAGALFISSVAKQLKAEGSVTDINARYAPKNPLLAQGPSCNGLHVFRTADSQTLQFACTILLISIINSSLCSSVLDGTHPAFTSLWKTPGERPRV